MQETSTVVQWLRFCALDAGAWVQSLTGGLDPTCRNSKICMLQLKIRHAAMKTEDPECHSQGLAQPNKENNK